MHGMELGPEQLLRDGTYAKRDMAFQSMHPNALRLGLTTVTRRRLAYLARHGIVQSHAMPEHGPRCPTCANPLAPHPPKCWVCRLCLESGADAR